MKTKINAAMKVIKIVLAGFIDLKDIYKGI
jgi:hypothetical protein